MNLQINFTTFVFIFKYVNSVFPASSNAFKLGTETTFSLINDVSLYDLKTADKPIGYRISGAVKVAAIWGSNDNGFLLRFEVTIIVLVLISQKCFLFISSWNHRNYICKSSKLSQWILMRNHRA